MQRARTALLKAALGTVGLALAVTLGPRADAAPLSVSFTAPHAYRGSDDSFFTGILLSGQDLFRVDLGAVVSKYIGETEKSLDAVFDRVGIADVVLLFDEADALFGKRTEIKDAHDRYAETFVVLDPVDRSWRGLIVLGPDDGVREDGVYELSGRYGDLVIRPIAAPPAIALFSAALVLGGLVPGRRRQAYAR